MCLSGKVSIVSTSLFVSYTVAGRLRPSPGILRIDEIDYFLLPL